MLGGDGDHSFDGAWVNTGFTWSSTSTPDGGLRSALADPRPRFKHTATPRTTTSIKHAATPTNGVP